MSLDFYKEITFVPTEKQEEIFNFVRGTTFPWYLQQATDNYRYFGHHLKMRHEPDVCIPGTINSEHHDFFESLFEQICQENDVDLNIIYRMALNCTYYDPSEYGDIHEDHFFPHKNFLFALNDFTGGPTYIFDNENNLIKTTSVGKYKGVFFGGEKHAAGFCQPQEERIIFVATFN